MENCSCKYDVQPGQNATVIRDLIKHENDLTNHRMMWLLIAQGFLVNAYVIVKADPGAANTIALAGIVVTLSVLVLLHKSYQARAYLHFVGDKAKQGKLREIDLPLSGWPAKRMKGWRSERWVCPCLERPRDLLETYLLLPAFSVTLWMSSLLGRWLSFPMWTVFGIASLITSIMIWVLLTALVKSQRKYEEDTTEDDVRQI